MTLLSGGPWWRVPDQGVHQGLVVGEEGEITTFQKEERNGGWRNRLPGVLCRRRNIWIRQRKVSWVTTLAREIKNETKK